jgi:hypothetical protein
MFDQLLSHFLASKLSRWLDAWVARGRRAEGITSDTSARWVLRYGTRYTIQSCCTAVGFGFAVALWAWLELIGFAVPIWCRLVYLLVFLPIFGLCVVAATRAFFVRVELDKAGITLRSLGAWPERFEWRDVTELHRSELLTSVILRHSDGRKMRVSFRLDGLQAFRDCLEQYVGIPLPLDVLARLPPPSCDTVERMERGLE